MSCPTNPRALSAEVVRDAELALTTMCFAKSEARGAVKAALDDEPENLEQLIRATLRSCAKPGG